MITKEQLIPLVKEYKIPETKISIVASKRTWFVFDNENIQLLNRYTLKWEDFNDRVGVYEYSSVDDALEAYNKSVTPILSEIEVIGQLTS